jgi:biotin carboxyl carrier protein
MIEDNEIYRLTVDYDKYETRITKKFKMRKPYIAKDPNKVYSFIPGLIIDVFVSQGQKIKRGDKLLILEAMKMKNDLKSPRDGIIKEIKIKTGEMVAKGDLLIEFEKN